MHAERSITGARGINRFNRKRHTAFRALLMCDRGQLRQAQVRSTNRMDVFCVQ